MPAKKSSLALTPLAIDSRIREVRGVRVLLDFHLAELYEVTTGALNQAVRRNRDRFPDDFAFRLTPEEFAALISQSVISKDGRGGRQQRPWAFTEHGVAMLSGVLRSETAVRVNIEIIRAFVRLRRLLATPGELVAQLRHLVQTVELHDQQIKEIVDVLQRMMAPPPEESTKRRFGFHPPEPVTAPQGKR
jgi:hypothetical protein